MTAPALATPVFIIDYSDLPSSGKEVSDYRPVPIGATGQAVFERTAPSNQSNPQLFTHDMHGDPSKDATRFLSSEEGSQSRPDWIPAKVTIGAESLDWR